MKEVTWEVQYLSFLPIVKYCKKCGKKTEYLCSGLFRINAQRKYLDIWLIYNCGYCDTSWNMTLYSRISPGSLKKELLEGFHQNKEELVERYGMDYELITKNGVEAGLPKYKILGDKIELITNIKLEIISKYPSQIKVASILREHLELSQKSFLNAIEQGQIKSLSGQSLKKSRLQKSNTILIQHP